MQDPLKYESSRGAAGADVILERYTVPLLNLMKWNEESKEKSENILDYGCGAGTTGFKYIFPRVGKNSFLYGVDITPAMISYANKNYTDERISFGVGNVLDGSFPFVGVKFDKVICINVFHHINNIRGALNGLGEIMKTGGELAFTSATNSFSIFKCLRVLAEMEEWKEYMKGYENFLPTWSDCDVDLRTHLVSILEKSGFQVKYLKVDKNFLFVSDVEAFYDFHLAVNPFLDKIPKELHPKLKEDYKKITTELISVPFESTEFNFPYTWISCLAIKR